MRVNEMKCDEKTDKNAAQVDAESGRNDVTRTVGRRRRCETQQNEMRKKMHRV